MVTSLRETGLRSSLADGSKLAFSSLNQSGFDIFVMRSPFERDLKIAQVEPTVFRKME